MILKKTNFLAVSAMTAAATIAFTLTPPQAGAIAIPGKCKGAVEKPKFKGDWLIGRAAVGRCPEMAKSVKAKVTFQKDLGYGFAKELPSSARWIKRSPNRGHTNSAKLHCPPRKAGKSRGRMRTVLRLYNPGNTVYKSAWGPMC